MIYFLLPSVNICIYKFIECEFNDEISQSNISNSLSYYLYEIKNKIKSCEKDWDIYKKYTNPYEYINSIVPDIYNKINYKNYHLLDDTIQESVNMTKNNKYLSKCVSKYKPLSRSYFKMIELLNNFIFTNNNLN